MNRMRFVGCKVVLILLAIFLLFGCGKGDLSGTYINPEGDSSHELILHKDGKGIFASQTMEYSVDGDNIILYVGPIAFKGKISGKKIIINDGISGTWTKQ